MAFADFYEIHASSTDSSTT